MSEIGNLRVKLSLDDAQFDKSVASMNRTLQAMGQEVRGLQNKGKDWGASLDGLKQKQDAHSRLLEGQQTKVRKLADEYEKAKQETGEHSAQTEKLAVQLNKASAEMNRTETELSQITAELQKQEAEMKKAQSNWTKMGESASAFGDKMQNVGGKIKDIGKEFSMKLTAPIVAMGVAVTKTAADFEAQMDRVGAIAGATGGEMEQLKKTAMELGASTSKSASEVAIGMENMAAMGFDAYEIIAAMPGIISAAEASGADMAQTADVVAASLNMFGLEAKEASRVADILAQSANQSAADITDLQYALKYAGPPAAALGLSIEETAAAIGLMTDAGMKGEQAGTTLRSALLSLLQPSEKNSKLMDTLGIAITDTDGKMLGISEIVSNLTASLDGMTEANKAATLSSIFGKEAVSGMMTLVAAGPEKIDAMTASLENSAGASKEAADKMMDNLKGALEELGGAFETLSIQLGDILIPIIRDVVVRFQGLVEKFSELSPTTQKLMLSFGALAAAIGPVILVMGMLISSVGTIVGAFGTVSLAIANAGGVMALLSTKLGFLGTAFSALTGPIGITIAAVVAIGAALVTAYNKVDWFRDGVNKTFDSIKNFTKTIFDTIKKTITSLLSSAVDLAKGILDDFKNFWNENGKFITSIVKVYMNNVKTNIEMVLGIIKGVFQAVFPIIASVVKVAFETVKFAVKNAMDLILGSITVAMKLLQGDWKGAWESVKKIAENIMNNIVGYFKGIDLRQIGVDIIQGLVNGIGSMTRAVTDKVKSITDGIKNSITGALKINSPSKLTTEYGVNVGEGLVIGMEDKIKQVVNAGKKLASAVTQPMDTISMGRMGNASTSINKSRSYKNGDTHIYVYGNNSSPSEIARKATQAQRQLAMEWGI